MGWASVLWGTKAAPPGPGHRDCWPPEWWVRACPTWLGPPRAPVCGAGTWVGASGLTCLTHLPVVLRVILEIKRFKEVPPEPSTPRWNEKAESSVPVTTAPEQSTTQTLYGETLEDGRCWAAPALRLCCQGPAGGHSPASFPLVCSEGTLLPVWPSTALQVPTSPFQPPLSQRLAAHLLPRAL